MYVFRFDSLSRAFLNGYFFRENAQRISVEGMPERIQMYVFSNNNALIWTGPNWVETDRIPGSGTHTWEVPNSFTRPTALYMLIGTLRSNDGDGNVNATKAIIRLNKQNNNFARAHAFLYISLPSRHDYDVKMPNFRMCRGSTQATTKFPPSFWSWIWFLGIQF